MATIVSDSRGASGVARRSAGQETDLVDGLRAGRRDAFQQLYELYRSRIYGLALRIVRSPEDACDITQDVFIKAFRKLPESPVSGPHLTPWLYRVTVNASYDHLRTRKLHGDIDALSADSPAVPVDTFEQAEMGRRVEQTLAALSERHRTALILKDIHGLRHDEMAEVLGVSRGATETLLFRAREAFRAKYLELTQDQPGSRNVEKWSAAGIGIGSFLHEPPLPAALQGSFPFAGAGAGAGMGAAAAGAAVGGAGAAGSSGGLTLAAGGLLAKVSGAATAKLAAVVIAATCATGGSVAAYETGVLPGTHPRHPAPSAQANKHAGGGDREKATGRDGTGSAASPTGTARSAAAKERAAQKKAAKGDKARGKPADKNERRDMAADKSNGKAGDKDSNGSGAAEASQGGGGSANAGGGSTRSDSGRGNGGGHSGDSGGANSNARGNSQKPDTTD